MHDVIVLERAYRCFQRRTGVSVDSLTNKTTHVRQVKFIKHISVGKNLLKNGKCVQLAGVRAYKIIWLVLNKMFV